MQHRDPGSLVIAILARHTGLPPEEISSSMRVRDDLGLDSIDAVELLMAIEQETGRRFELTDTDDVATVGEIIARVTQPTT